MATEVILESLPHQQAVTINRVEALQVIALLTAQLAGEALPYNSKEACPTLSIMAGDVVSHYLILQLEGK